MKSRSLAYMTLIFLLSGLANCEDQCSSFSPNKFNCDQIAGATYNVHFSLPDETEVSLGQITGLSNCAARASEYASQHSVPKKYYCCMVTETSSCAERHH